MTLDPNKLYEPPIIALDAPDPRAGLDCVPMAKGDFAKFSNSLLSFSVSEIMQTMQLVKTDTESNGKLDTQLRYQFSTHMGLVKAIAELATEIRTLVLLGRDRRHDLEMRLRALVEDTTKALNRRIEALEARPVFEDAGVWAQDRGYKHGHGVTHGGSYFIAQRDTQPGEKPGDADSGFRLAVKRGRDAR
ncbi:hypothetical protein J4G43_004980 [Bradyrhizobium barranii subsp. barranii]|uniref:Uncharacterized protein n=1 Tax=Bradyrhizobium barranii subsp. barranii TaxID=2823807 RepID=A0A939M1C9_9BRAD|nr:hypothetical protein [Bradyrhizobium barranii]UEM13677.1 hypothetical protein J4G43_004980 [Bradyrhizobium barranii subsp. barranii]